MLRHRSRLETDGCQRLDSRRSTGINPPKPSNLRAVGAAKGPKKREARCNRSLPARRNPLQTCTPAPRNVISVGLGFHRHFGDHLAGAKKVLQVEALNGWMSWMENMSWCACATNTQPTACLLQLVRTVVRMEGRLQRDLGGGIYGHGDICQPTRLRTCLNWDRQPTPVEMRCGQLPNAESSLCDCPCCWACARRARAR